MAALMGKFFNTVSMCINRLFYYSFSRRVLWLNVGVSNNNPKIIAHHFINCVKHLGGTIIIIYVYIACSMFHIVIGVPRIVRADCGTENTNVAFIQPFLRHNHGDCFSGALSFRYGSSVTNQVSYITTTS